MKRMHIPQDMLITYVHAHNHRSICSKVHPLLSLRGPRGRAPRGSCIECCIPVIAGESTLPWAMSRQVMQAVRPRLSALTCTLYMRIKLVFLALSCAFEAPSQRCSSSERGASGAIRDRFCTDWTQEVQTSSFPLPVALRVACYEDIQDLWNDLFEELRLELTFWDAREVEAMNRMGPTPASKDKI